MSLKPKQKRLKVSSLLVCLLFLQQSFGQGRFEEVGFIADERTKALKKDVALVVANKDTIIFQKDTKLFSAQRGQASIGLTSQWLTAALVMVLVDEGKISLDDKVSQYIPVYGAYMKSYVTIGHCLSHFTGIQSESSKVSRLFEKKKFESLEAEVAEYAKKEIQNNAGEAFRFNQMGPEIAGRILEIVSKKRFDMLAQQKLFRPLGMRQTTFSTLDGSVVSPSSGARSTAVDLTRFLRMLLNNGMHNGQRILSEKSVAALRNVLTAPELRKANPETARTWEYSLGAWSPEETNNKQASVLTAPSFEGTTALVDFCRGYAFVYLQPELTEEPKVPVGNQIKGALDQIFSSKCR